MAEDNEQFSVMLANIQSLERQLKTANKKIEYYKNINKNRDYCPSCGSQRVVGFDIGHYNLHCHSCGHTWPNERNKSGH